MRVHPAQDQGCKEHQRLAASLTPSCADITAHAFLDQKERTKTPHSLDMDAITMLLHIPFNHLALNRFPYSLSRIGRTTSRCAACHHARLSFFLSWVSMTQSNHWSKQMASTRIATKDPRTCPGPEDRSII